MADEDDLYQDDDKDYGLISNPYTDGGRAPVEPRLVGDRLRALMNDAVDAAEPRLQRASPAASQPEPQGAASAVAPGLTTNELISSYINVAAQHAAAAEANSPDQPWLLASRMALSQNVVQDFNNVAELAKRSPAHLKIVEADVAEYPNIRDIGTKRVGELISGGSWSGTPDQLAIFADQARLYESAKRQHAIYSASRNGQYREAGETNVVARATADLIMQNGQIITLAMRNPNLALQALADAGYSRTDASLAAVNSRKGLAQSYLTANRDAVEAVKNHNWETYAVAAAGRTAVMAKMLQDPVSLVALGFASREAGIDVRAKAIDDLRENKARRDQDLQEDRERDIARYASSFLEAKTPEEANPLRRWIKIQNEIERQENSPDLTRSDIGSLKILSEQVAIEAASSPTDWGRLQIARPDLMNKLVREAGRQRRERLHLDESLEQDPSLGDPRDAELGTEMVPTVPKKAPELLKSDAEVVNSPPNAGNQFTSLRADPRERIINPVDDVKAANNAAGDPGLAAEHDNLSPPDRSPAKVAEHQATAANSSHLQTAAPMAPYIARAINDKQRRAMEHKNQKNPQFDSDAGPFLKPAFKEAPKDFGAYVNARTPYTPDTIAEQLNDPRKLVLALPLNDFGSRYQWKIKKALRQIAEQEPERFKAMYQATKDTHIKWRDARSETEKEALDKIELGRRMLAEVGYKTGHMSLFKVGKHAQIMYSKSGQRMTPKDRLDPHDHIQLGEVKHYAACVKNMATTGVRHWAKQHRQKQIDVIKTHAVEYIAGNKEKGIQSIEKRAAKGITKFLMDEVAQLHG